ncbi:DMT family transporter [Synoicihabitans lomoniglobus]|uniref:DMT family transporter n=1 Tax=Synoicihabitans lomoniglobus TaxID=2909285 RepID=A0AAE9ZVX7_9BACT|nr:DMT family transporter [Opitutaceae bacterium LMO-M01]WED64149.1 DMT family transporter [Opitutaceae bacterium LMO-M01]
MPVSLHLLIPLASSVGYVAGVLLLKRSAAFGIGVWRTTFLANILHAVCIAPAWALGPGHGEGAAWWQPIVAGSLFFIGQVATFNAIERGDVSVATPVLGSKILLVALFSALFLPDPVPLKWWIAAALSVTAIALLNRQPKRAHGTVATTAMAPTILSALGAALAFACCDVLVQKWAPAWGPGRFVPLMFGSLALASFALIPVFRAPLREIPQPALPWVLGGATLLGLQAVGINLTIGIFGDATAVNVVYSSRGLWSVLAVWWIGHWFLNDEKKLGSAVLRFRLIGATLMLAAIGLVLV